MRVLITGASRGIGRATARRLAGPGVDLALHYRSHAPEARALADELGGCGARCRVLGADLGDGAQVDALADELSQAWPSLDVLVHNAGRYPRAAFETISPEEFEACVRVNLLGPARLTRALLPLLRRSPAARIVFVASVLAFTGSGHGAPYAAAKAGVVALARSLARELAPSIAVNVVAPGPIDTDILAHDTPDQRRAREAELPLRRVGRPEEIAEVIAFLASPAASYMTGAVVHANGGAYLG